MEPLEPKDRMIALSNRIKHIVTLALEKLDEYRVRE